MCMNHFYPYRCYKCRLLPYFYVNFPIWFITYFAYCKVIRYIFNHSSNSIFVLNRTYRNVCKSSKHLAERHPYTSRCRYFLFVKRQVLNLFCSTIFVYCPVMTHLLYCNDRHSRCFHVYCQEFLHYASKNSRMKAKIHDYVKWLIQTGPS